MSRREPDLEVEQSDMEDSEVVSVSIPDSLLSVSRSDLVAEQRGDPTPNELFGRVSMGRVPLRAICCRMGCW